MKYYVDITINDTMVSNEQEIDLSTVTMKKLYHIGKSLVRYGKRNCVKVRFIVYNDLGKRLFWLYSRESALTGNFIAKQSRIGVYGRKGIEF